MTASRKTKNSGVKLPTNKRMRDIADQLWSLAVRDDWAWKCAVCGGGKPEAHHLLPRHYHKTRYELRNGIALCSYHHQFCPQLSPHQNAAGWMQWLLEHHPETWQWFMAEAGSENSLSMKRDRGYFVATIQELGQYVSDDDFDRICGKRFSAWLHGLED